MNLFNINRDSWMYMRKTCDTTITMFERTMYLATILLLESSIDFIITALMVSTMQKCGQ